MPNEWRPIHTAPAGETVDVWSAISGRETDAKWDESNKSWKRWGFSEMNDGPGWEYLYQVTHWMPLPEPPKED